MKKMKMIEEIKKEKEIEMERDKKVVVLGEDVGYLGGVLRWKEGLKKK